MKIGKPIREFVVEPLESPVPAVVDGPPKRPEPVVSKTETQSQSHYQSVEP
jgi:hypothetical protein